MIIQHFPMHNIIIRTKTFARYTDEYNNIQINFIPSYVLNENNTTFIGLKNDLIGTYSGYFPVEQLTGTLQLNMRNLSNIHSVTKH